jgi:hypothetical protein
MCLFLHVSNTWLVFIKYRIMQRYQGDSVRSYNTNLDLLELKMKRAYRDIWDRD